MFDEIKSWIRKDKYNIVLSILCALISIVPAFWGSNFLAKYCICNKTDVTSSQIVMIGVFLLVCIGMGFLIFKYRPTAMDDIRDKEALMDYIEEECGIKQTQNNNSEMAYEVVRGSVKQFFMAWQIIWFLWIIYFGVEIFRITNYPISVSSISQNKTLLAIQELKYLLDFITSTALFSVYFILNNITVNINNRADKNNHELLYSISACIFLFAILVVLQMMYLPQAIPNVINKYDIYTRLILGFFGTMSFVLVLGKLNSSYLSIPRLLMFWLYVYAIFQILFCMGGIELNDEGMLADVLKSLVRCSPWFYVIGKTALLMTLSWVLYRKRLIFYIIHESLAITDNPRRLNKFNRYMSD